MKIGNAVLAAAILGISGVAQAQVASPTTPSGTMNNGITPHADARGDRSATGRDAMPGMTPGSAMGPTGPVGSPTTGPSTTLGSTPGITAPGALPAPSSHAAPPPR